MFEFGGGDGLTDGRTAFGPGIVAYGRVGAGFPEFRGEPGRQGVRTRAPEILVHPGQLLDREEIPVGQPGVSAF
ncbi:hypothetical protein C493_03275 [Natronolimnohabitans innermongolicus JCM 12255]|uniref:Uncharacterized protein n=1 Tax=Natronolimnohabitans innermongolicus JCM 12255 TaxID=1227499 RepID=L9XHN2_9EURY|nr:hypothetical protein C493_03275 [Natronolimnohabitans innermongolicus JCM 12255]